MTSRRRARADAVSLLTAYLVLLFGVPSALAFRPLGSAGTPANLVGLAGLVWWACTLVVPHTAWIRRWNPAHALMGCLGVMVLASYVAAALRAGAPAAEIRAADRGLLTLLAWAGVVLVVADGVRNRQRLETLAGRLVAAACVLAFLGIAQFFTGVDVVGLYRIPGLSADASLTLISERGEFRRIAGTAVHPIEFGVVLAMLLPIALHRAWFAPPDRAKWRWAQVAIVGAAIPMAVSRSAVVAALAAAAVLFAGWDRRRRMRALLVLPVFLVIMRVMVPGLLGTIKNLFLDIEEDSSTQARTEDFAALMPYVQERPLFGRGFHTFLPETYRWVDNQLLLGAVETGLVGLALLLTAYAVGFFTARGARRRSKDQSDRDLAQAIAAGIAAAAATAATFDELSFPMVTGVLMLLFGLAGALWRFAEDDRLAESWPAPRREAVAATR